MSLARSVWKKQFQQIANVLYCMGYFVEEETDEDDRVCFESKCVYINSRKHPETKFYTLLHELGHVLVSMDWIKFKSENPMYVHSPDRTIDGRQARTRAYRVSLVSEELEAWKLGRRFANSLDMFIDDEKYNKHMSSAIMSYINWAADDYEE